MRITTLTPKMLTSVVIGAQRQPNLTKVSQLVPTMITTTMVEGHVESTTNLAINRMLVGSIPNLNCGSRGIPLGKSFELEFEDTSTDH